MNDDTIKGNEDNKGKGRPLTINDKIKGNK